MSAHDDYLDVRSAFKAYERAYIAWGNAADGNIADDDEARDEIKAKKLARKLALASHELRNTAISALTNLEKRGWPIPKKCMKAWWQCDAPPAYLVRLPSGLYVTETLASELSELLSHGPRQSDAARFTKDRARDVAAELDGRVVKLKRRGS